MECAVSIFDKQGRTEESEYVSTPCYVNFKHVVTVTCTIILDYIGQDDMLSEP